MVTFFLRTGFFYPTVVYFLLIYASLTICAENLFLLRPLIARLSTETAAFLLFGFFVASLFVSGCIQTFTSASRRCHFHCHQPLRHSPAVALPFSRLLRLPVAVVGFLVVLLFHRQPLIRSLQLVVAIIGLPLVFTSASNSQCRLIVVLRVPQESYKSSYRPVR